VYGFELSVALFNVLPRDAWRMCFLVVQWGRGSVADR
jgi:hypothetical protein